MLDYRAHKLLWLMSLPFRLFAWFVYFLAIFIAIVIAQRTSYDVLIQIIIAYAIFEGILLVVLLLVLTPIGWALKRCFFFLIDVVPAHGANAAEAREIALTGRLFELNKKLETDIEGWSFDDTDEYVRLMNWRTRLLNRFKGRFEFAIEEFKAIFEETGKQPGEIGLSKINEIYARSPGGKPSWFEKTIVSQWSFNALLAFTIISISVSYLS